MAHVHKMRDSDNHFVVDPVTRSISNKSLKSILVQNDHNSEIFTFEVPRYVEGHDMYQCNRVEIHYVNTDSSNRLENMGMYEVTDFTVSEDDENVVVWSWTISNNATKFVGSLIFSFRFACCTNETVDYAWSTTPYSSITISKGLYNGEQVVEEYIDILQLWSQKIGVSVEDVRQTSMSSEPNGANVVTLILTNGKRESFVIRNGITPIRGVDYWTEEDKQEIINSILGVIPEAEEASF